MSPDSTRSKSGRTKKPEVMSVVSLRFPDHLLKTIDDFLKYSDFPDRSSLIRQAVATYIGRPELAEQRRGSTQSNDLPFKMGRGEDIRQRMFPKSSRSPGA